VTHRIVKHSPLRRLVPDWKSWNAGRKFPMGLPLGMTLVFYLLLAATQS
jgi:prepilin peptidase CpaA